MNPGDNTDQKIYANAVARLKARGEGFRPDTRHPRLVVWFVREGVVHVVRQLTVNADWLNPVQHGVPRSFEHEVIGYSRRGEGKRGKGKGSATLRGRRVEGQSLLWISGRGHQRLRQVVHADAEQSHGTRAGIGAGQ